MNSPIITSRIGLRTTFAGFLAAAILGPARSSSADLTLISSSGTASYAVNDTTIGTGFPVFNSDGSMASPGFEIASLLGPSEGLPTQSVGPGSLVPSFLAISQTTSDSRGNGVPSEFGSAGTQILATGSGQGETLPQGGVIWSTKTSLADNLSMAGQASVSITMGTATFLNATGSTINFAAGTLGAVLNVKGTISDTGGSFVAAGLSASFQLSGTTGPTMLAPIVLAGANGNGFFSTGSVTGDAGTANFNSGVLTAKATSYASGVISLANGQSITITGVLTLVSDPGSSIGISSDAVSGFTGTDPVFGIGADGPQLQVVPEPSTMVFLASGLATSGLFWLSSRSRRAPANS